MTPAGPLHLGDRTWLAVGRVEDLLGPGQRPATARGRETVASRALLRQLLASFNAEGEPVASRPSGQPHLPGRPDLAISISHTDDWVAAAVQTTGGDGPAAVGVDVETPRPVGPRLIARCTTPQARELLARMPAPQQTYEFTTIWTVQEACVKADGTGLAGRPWAIPVDVGQRSGRWRRYHWQSLRDQFPVPVSCAFAGDQP
jgi:4'-phosphopantetheinyl transferase